MKRLVFYVSSGSTPHFIQPAVTRNQLILWTKSREEILHSLRETRKNELYMCHRMALCVCIRDSRLINNENLLFNFN